MRKLENDRKKVAEEKFLLATNGPLFRRKGRNLTAVEAKLAYEERCRRRLQKLQQHRTGGQRYVDDRRMQSGQLQPPVSPVTDESVQQRSSRVIVNVNSH